MNTLRNGLIAAFIAFTTIPAQAGVGDEIMLGRFSGLPELTQSGASLVNFVEGREVVDQPHLTRAAVIATEDQAQSYYGDSVILTLAMLGIASIAFAAVAAASRKRSERVDPEAPVGHNWRDELMRMLEADLTNSDGLKPGVFSH